MERRYKITPGHTVVAITAAVLYGMDNVNPGSWASPVGVTMPEEDVDAFKALAEEAVQTQAVGVERFKLLPLIITPER